MSAKVAVKAGIYPPSQVVARNLRNPSVGKIQVNKYCPFCCYASCSKSPYIWRQTIHNYIVELTRLFDGQEWNPT